MDTTLRNAVIRAVGRTSLPDVAMYGADQGFPGFTNYSDTCAFYARHQGRIVEMVEELARDLGQSPTEMVGGFKCLQDVEATDQEIGQTLYGTKRKHDTHVANALAWFALEQVAFDDADK